MSRSSIFELAAVVALGASIGTAYRYQREHQPPPAPNLQEGTNGAVTVFDVPAGSVTYVSHSYNDRYGCGAVSLAVLPLGSASLECDASRLTGDPVHLVRRTGGSQAELFLCRADHCFKVLYLQGTLATVASTLDPGHALPEQL